MIYWCLVGLIVASRPSESIDAVQLIACEKVGSNLEKLLNYCYGIWVIYIVWEYFHKLFAQRITAVSSARVCN